MLVINKNALTWRYVNALCQEGGEQWIQFHFTVYILCFTSLSSKRTKIIIINYIQSKTTSLDHHNVQTQSRHSPFLCVFTHFKMSIYVSNKPVNLDNFSFSRCAHISQTKTSQLFYFYVIFTSFPGISILSWSCSSKQQWH